MKHPLKLLLALSAILFSSLTAVAADTSVEPRLSTTTFQNITTQNHYPAGTEKTREAATTERQFGGLWVYDLFINLTTDIDFDGYYSSFNVSLDLDASFSSQTVYAVMYLSHNNGPWLEYAVTGNFFVSGEGSHDSIFIQSNLDSGYPSGYYDHFIEVYDAFNNSLLLSYGPNQSFVNIDIPFESYDHDNFVTTTGFISTPGLSVAYAGSGSLSLKMLLGFIGLLGLQRYTRWVS